MLIAIPTCGASPYLKPLVQSLSAEADNIVVMINHVDEQRAAGIVDEIDDYASWEYHRDEPGIYWLWNQAVQMGRDTEECVAILNDDLEMDARTLEPMESAMWQRGYAILGWDYVHRNMYNLDRIQPVQGTFRRGGIGGFAFCVHPKLVDDIDERFHWWGGDDDLVYRTIQKGHQVGIAMGLGVTHHPSMSAAARPEVLEHVEEDRLLLRSKWGESW